MAKNRLSALGERNSQITKTTNFVDKLYSETSDIDNTKDESEPKKLLKPKNNKYKKDFEVEDNYKNFLFPLKKDYHYYLKHVIAPQNGMAMYEVLEKALEEVYPDIKNFKA